MTKRFQVEDTRETGALVKCATRPFAVIDVDQNKIVGRYADLLAAKSAARLRNKKVAVK